MRVPIPISIRYKYRDYPEAPKLTKKSKNIGYFTGTAGYLVFGLFLWPILFGILGTILPEDAAMLIGLVLAAVILRWGLTQWRKTAYEKLDKQYLEQLNQWQQTDPARYFRAAQKLQARQNAK